MFLALLQTAQGLVLNLANAFTTQAQIFTNILERRIFNRIKTIEHAKDFFFALRQSGQGFQAFLE